MQQFRITRVEVGHLTVVACPNIIADDMKE